MHFGAFIPESIVPDFSVPLSRKSFLGFNPQNPPKTGYGPGSNPDLATQGSCTSNRTNHLSSVQLISYLYLPGTCILPLLKKPTLDPNDASYTDLSPTSRTFLNSSNVSLLAGSLNIQLLSTFCQSSSQHTDPFIRPKQLCCQSTTTLLPMPTMSVGVGRIFEFVRLSVCLQHNSKTNDPKVFKLGVVNDLEIY